jgi:hypothetical protein
MVAREGAEMSFILHFFEAHPLLLNLASSGAMWLLHHVFWHNEKEVI